MKKHDLTDELSNQNLRNQPFLCHGKIDLDGKLDHTILPYKKVTTSEIILDL